ncbi:GntR family transcriptional regulator [Fervidicella metallireducens AeB]|uniref:GntR family transcriptional regulator n=1 Tax=Fervidicella metallireducens AeB TaxID=1403537 RepID=A0A017RTA0_9CLOT|nr:PLP-dependent aminotransferase family protein [Fervidicella metallireducens]EYE87973.1 GntR family transcriptional regulator [Fervidicella metallireducens AeB]
MFRDLNINNDRPVYLQIKDYIKELIIKGILQKDVKLPSTRELGEILNVSRNTIILAYEYLEDEGFIRIVKGRGAFVSDIKIKPQDNFNLSWDEKINDYARFAERLDIIKNEIKWEKGMISFKSISPDSSLFDMDEFKKAFLNRISMEGDKILNYGYAQGYKPLIEYLLKYMENKGVDVEGKEILITNGFTEGFDIVVSAITNKGDKIICENPTHNTAIKIMKLHELDIHGVEMDDDGMNINKLEEKLYKEEFKFVYIVPSYHNPTGIVTSPEKRIEIFNACRQRGVPLIEDGFNEELRYSGSHIAPIISLNGKGNGVIYLGSFSKILFPGMRIGWILADKDLISVLESIKRSRNIHTSFLDQAILYEYLKGGNFEKYLKRARKEYREKFEIAYKAAKELIPCRDIKGEGGLHIFVELRDINARDVLFECCKNGVIFTPGDIFYTDGKGKNTFRLGFSRVSKDEIIKGFKVIGDVVRKMEG